MRQDILKHFQELIYKETGIVYNERNSFALETRLQKVAQKLELESVEALYESCRTSIANDVKSFILDIATNNETSFFRDMHIFTAVKEQVIIPAIERGKQHFQIWSAACSAGQEPYSIAFLMEDLKVKYPSLSYRITASDISKEILARAQAGAYSQLEVQRGLPTPYLVKHFERAEAKPGEPADWKIKSGLKANISFRHLNLLAPYPALGPFDLVFLRNVLIYHDENHRTEILDKIHQKMSEGGRLFLGSAERVLALDHLYEIHVEGRAVSYITLPRNGSRQAV